MPERGLDSVPFRVWNEALTIKTMPNINDNFLKLQAGYLFPEIGRRVNAFAESHPEAAKRLIRCGIGDVTEPRQQVCGSVSYRTRIFAGCGGKFFER